MTATATLPTAVAGAGGGQPLPADPAENPLVAAAATDPADTPPEVDARFDAPAIAAASAALC
ncbi:MAG: hypothetical protein WBY66_11360, partial [Candidatus Acidiferrales bacterium]